MYANDNEKKYVTKMQEGNVTIRRCEPYNYFDARADDDVFRVCLPYGYISDYLSEEVSAWNSEKPVFIAADTGLGKNTFMENFLISRVRKAGGKILFLSNRVALGRQEKKRLAKIFNMEDMLDDYTDKGLDKLIRFGCLTVVSYQQLGAWINEESFMLQEITKYFFDFVVVDEAHFFLNDCCFNPWTDIVLRFIVSQFQASVRIYMTATPEQIFPVLKKKDVKLIKEQRKYLLEYRTWLLYEFAHDFSWIHAKAFSDLSDIVDIIRRKPEKWLVFVDSKTMGKELQEMIGEGVLLTAESKNPEDPTYPVFSQLIKKERSDIRVIIATAVLENGMNIKDSELKNIAIFSDGKTQFLQMLGRVRRMAGDINLYIPDTSNEQISKRLKSCCAIYRAVEAFDNDATKFYQDYILPDNPPAKIKMAVSFQKNKVAHLNGLLKLKTTVFDYPFWTEMCSRSRSGEEYVMLKEKFSWIEKEFHPEDFESRKKYDEAYAMLISFLDEQAGKTINSDEKNEFSCKFTTLYKSAFGARKEDKCLEQTYGLNVIKKLLTERNLPFVIKNDKFGWTVEKSETEEKERSKSYAQIIRSK